MFSGLSGSFFSMMGRVIVLAVVFLGASQAAQAQFSMVGAAKITFRGTVIDSSRKVGLSNALVTIRTEYDEYRTYTDSDGEFVLEVASPKEMKDFEIVFSHPDYREKYFNTAFDRAIRGTFEAKVQSGQVKVKHYKTKSQLNCGGTLSVGTKDGGPVSAQLTCGNQLTFALNLPDGNSLSVMAPSAFEFKVEKEKVQIQGISGSAITVGLTAVVYKR
ncbi:MAG: carboxypeptidase regulatory-like domain-containing protein [Acidobacteria bacterium]|nr:carboxypeptidase regulatory-like domain-containing protein [Acidobacteriota bacterium]